MKKAKRITNADRWAWICEHDDLWIWQQKSGLNKPDFIRATRDRIDECIELHRKQAEEERLQYA